MRTIFHSMLELLRTGERFAFGIITGVKGSSPQKLGAKALFLESGRIEGTLGGGCLEAEVRHRAMEVLKTGLPQTFDLLLDHDFGWDDGLICGGKVRGIILPSMPHAAAIWSAAANRESSQVWGITDGFDVRWIEKDQSHNWLYEECIEPPMNLWIAGSGHIARAVAPLGVRLDFNVTVFDDRPALANHTYFPREAVIRVDYWERLLQESLPPSPVFGLIVTRGHQHDALVLKEWINKPFAFLGMIGSERKKRLIFDQFESEGIASRTRLNTIACPVGMHIDSVSVEEIAVSIAAQLIQERAKLRRKLKSNSAPIKLLA
jgi:xanthine dehydrogenase accessory factor